MTQWKSIARSSLTEITESASVQSWIHANHRRLYNHTYEDYGIARTYRCTGQSYRYPFPQMGTDGKTSLGTDAVPVEHRYRYRKRHCSASRTLVQVQTYRISTVPVEYRYR